MAELKQKIYVLHTADNVGTALTDIAAGNAEFFGVTQGKLTIVQQIQYGHKVSLRDIEQGENIIKYGHAIGIATQAISRGSYVGANNCESRIGRSITDQPFQAVQQSEYRLIEYPARRRQDNGV